MKYYFAGIFGLVASARFASCVDTPDPLCDVTKPDDSCWTHTQVVAVTSNSVSCSDITSGKFSKTLNDALVEYLKALSNPAAASATYTALCFSKDYFQQTFLLSANSGTAGDEKTVDLSQHTKTGVVMFGTTDSSTLIASDKYQQSTPNPFSDPSKIPSKDIANYAVKAVLPDKTTCDTIKGNLAKAGSAFGLDAEVAVKSGVAGYVSCYGDANLILMAAAPAAKNAMTDSNSPYYVLNTVLHNNASPLDLKNTAAALNIASLTISDDFTKAIFADPCDNSSCKWDLLKKSAVEFTSKMNASCDSLLIDSNILSYVLPALSAIDSNFAKSLAYAFLCRTDGAGVYNYFTYLGKASSKFTVKVGDAQLVEQSVLQTIYAKLVEAKSLPSDLVLKSKPSPNGSLELTFAFTTFASVIMAVFVAFL